MYEEYDAALLEVARLSQTFGTAYAESIIEAAESLIWSEEAEAMAVAMREILDLAIEKEEIFILLKKWERRKWLDARRYARERERTQARAYRMTMKHHKVREVARFKRQKRIYGGLM